jgi:hypothetical protein
MNMLHIYLVTCMVAYQVQTRAVVQTMETLLRDIGSRSKG